MEKFLKDYLINKKNLNSEYYNFEYDENINKDALSDDWLENRTSYIYSVGVMAAIDSNKCDFAHIVIATKRRDKSIPEIKGSFYFGGGENDDMGRVMERAFKLIRKLHPAFDD